MMDLLYDERDDESHEARGSQILYWLDDLGAKPLAEARPENDGFLFAGARPIDDYTRLIGPYPLLRDRPEERAPLLRLDTILDALSAAGVGVPTPRTWRLPLDAPIPDDLTYPLFLRTAHTSLKLGGRVSRVRRESELEAEAAQLRRVLGWDALILAREWCDLAEAGSGAYGPVPQEVRVWVVDRVPSLSLFGTKVTDAGLKELVGLRNLTSLSLAYTGVTDAGLKELAAYKRLTSLELGGTKVTEAGVGELQKALPECKIEK
jgi:hypothetical protein